jgi:hypothetical protein
MSDTLLGLVVPIQPEAERTMVVVEKALLQEAHKVIRFMLDECMTSASCAGHCKGCSLRGDAMRVMTAIAKLQGKERCE